jgi:curved DNA-binding protein CbpA
MSKKQNIQPLRSDSSRRTEPEPRTLDPGDAESFRLPPSFKLDPEQAKRWPDGFWDHLNRAASFYKRGKYLQAKSEYLTAHYMLSTYESLNTSLLRTFRKLYKASLKDEEWEQAYRELSELFETLPSSITDTDRRQYNKVVEQLRSMDAGFTGRPVLLEKDKYGESVMPLPEVESAHGVDIAVETDELWSRPKGLKHVRLQENLTTHEGFVAISHTYDRQARGYVSSRIWTYSSDGEAVSERDINEGFYRIKISETCDRLIGYSDDLRLSLWTMAGKRLAERDIAREAEGSKYHIRCVDVSEGASHALFTSSTRAYLLDQSLNTVRIWIMPPPEGYEVRRKGMAMPDSRIQSAVSTLELTGNPSQVEIKSQFRRLALLHHPDRNPDDPIAEDRMKAIIKAYHILSDEDILEALEDIEGGEYYYRVIHEAEIEMPGMGVTLGFTMSVSGPGDWIYASHMTPRAKRIYLGCYSGAVYCMDLSGDVLSIYSTDEPIRGLREWTGFLYVWTDGSMYVIESDKAANHLDLRNRSIKCFAQWGFIIRNGYSLELYSLDGTWLGAVHLVKPPREIVPTRNGFVVYTTKVRFRVSLA